MWQLRYTATWGRPTQRQSLSALISSPMPSLKSPSSLPSYSVFTAHTLRCAVTLTFDLRPWTFVVYRLCHGQTLYQIWVKSNNPRRSYCDFNIWRYDLDTYHVLLNALCSGIVCKKFKPNQAMRSWNVTIFYANTSYHAITLSFDPLTLKVCGRSVVAWS